MNEPVRLAGRGRIGEATVTWTVSAGRRGRRWREVLTRDGAIVHALLLETDADDRFAHLELATPGALLTLHPEVDGTLHGNRVDAAGTAVEHVEGLPFGRDALVLVDDSPIATAAAVWALRTAAVVARSPLERRAARIDAGGRVSILDAVHLGRLADGAWSLATGGGGAAVISIDERGIPHLDDGAIWPLERSGSGLR